MNVRVHNIGLIFFLIACIWACSDSRIVYENFRSLSPEIWNRDSCITFNAEIAEPGNYTLGIYIRHSTDYKLSNLSCILQVYHPDSNKLSDTVDITLIKPSGEWYGQGGTGFKTLFVPLPKEYTFDSTGMYEIVLRHRMREKELKGIKNMGVTIRRP